MIDEGQAYGYGVATLVKNPSRTYSGTFKNNEFHGLGKKNV